MNRFHGYVLGLVALLAMMGCDSTPPTGTVTGTVKLQGKAVNGGTISFVAKTGGIPVGAFIGKDGTYRAENVPAGEVLVSVQSPVEESEADGQIIKNQGKEGKAAAPKPKPMIYPPQYADPGTSNLKTTVKPSAETTFDVDMTK
jgi:hypothetical protein